MILQPGSKICFPDALKGLKSREEVEDYIDAEYTVSKPSRTEQLKQELNQGVSNVDAVYGFSAGVENQEAGQENPASEEPQAVEQVGEDALKLHIEIKRLIEETGFTEERLKKALKFYKVDSIDELDWEAAHHFVLKLTK